MAMMVGLFGVLSIVLGLFLVALSVIAIIRVLQIAEDLRYMRSKSDISVQRPKKYTRDVLIALAVAAGLTLLVLMFLAAASGVGGTSTVKYGLPFSLSGLARNLIY